MAPRLIKSVYMYMSYQPTGMWAYLYLTCIATSNIGPRARYPGSSGFPSIFTPLSEHPRGHACRQGREVDVHVQRSTDNKDNDHHFKKMLI